MVKPSGIYDNVATVITVFLHYKNNEPMKNGNAIAMSQYEMIKYKE